MSCGLIFNIEVIHYCREPSHLLIFQPFLVNLLFLTLAFRLLHTECMMSVKFLKNFREFVSNQTSFVLFS